MTTQPLVIIPCGGKKADGPRPARDLYIGSYFRACLATALAVVLPTASASCPPSTAC